MVGDAGNTVFVSAASAWEITTKCRIGKLPGAVSIAADLTGVLAAQSLVSLPISLAHGQAAGALPGPHKDPFDWMLMVQAMRDDMVLVSNRRQFDSYGIRRLW